MSKIFIQLLDEGTTTFRPTQGEQLEDGIFRVLPTNDYNAETETWEFLPGSVVECLKEVKSGKEVLVAKRLVNSPQQQSFRLTKKDSDSL